MDANRSVNDPENDAGEHKKDVSCLQVICETLSTVQRKLQNDSFTNDAIVKIDLLRCLEVIQLDLDLSNTMPTTAGGTEETPHSNPLYRGGSTESLQGANENQQASLTENQVLAGDLNMNTIRQQSKQLIDIALHCNYTPLKSEDDFSDMEIDSNFSFDEDSVITTSRPPLLKNNTKSGQHSPEQLEDGGAAKDQARQVEHNQELIVEQLELDQSPKDNKIVDIVIPLLHELVLKGDIQLLRRLIGQGLLRLCLQTVKSFQVQR